MQKRASLSVFLITLVAVLLLAGCSSPLLSAESLSVSSGTPEQITLTWVGNPQTTQSITWSTKVTLNAGKVQYAEAVEGIVLPKKNKIMAARVEKMGTNLGEVSIHSATLVGLKPGMRYLYRVGDESSWSETHAFTTAPSKVSGFKFLVFGDSQSTNYGTWHDTVHQAYQAHRDAKFMTNVGDLVDVGQDYAQWNGWFKAAKGVVENLPIMPVAGNHEAYTPERKKSMPVLFTGLFTLPKNGPEQLLEQVYSFDYGDVHFIVLDSQETEEKEFIPTMLEMQRKWLERDLGQTQKKWKIVFVHRPPYDNKLIGESHRIREAFVPLFDQYHVDVVFTGHDHVYARTYPLKNGLVVDKSDKGTIYVATGRSGTKTYRSTVSKSWNEFFYNPLDEPNYLAVEVNGDLLKVQAFKQSGNIIDSWSIRKALQQK